VALPLLLGWDGLPPKSLQQWEILMGSLMDISTNQYKKTDVPSLANPFLHGKKFDEAMNQNFTKNRGRGVFFGPTDPG
jgi:hypothetical protein